MDALSDVLRAVRLTGAVFFDVKAVAPWVAESPAGGSIVDSVLPGSQHLISYHVVTRGSCWGGLIGQPAVHLSAGDIIVFPHGDAHVMSSSPGMRGSPVMALYEQGDRPRPFSFAIGGDSSGEPAHVVCGFLGCDTQPFNPLLTALPAVIRVGDRADGPIGAFARFAMAESTEPRIGGECVLGRLSELMFVDVVRRYLETLPAERTDWLAGLRDPAIGRVLAALHAQPARDWTLDLLSREAGLSRSALAERFTEFVGQPPIQYLASWRMQLAANYLQGGGDSLAAVAERVGYESEAAFSRAFRKAVGVPPGQWRKQRPPEAARAAAAG